jgi:TPR repeat protein
VDIKERLAAARTESDGRELVEWADETARQIARGDMMIGIVSVDEASKIPAAYRLAAELGVATAWLKLAWWSVAPLYGDTFFAAANDALARAVAADVTGAKLDAVKIRWHYLRDDLQEEERHQTFQYASDLAKSGIAEALYYVGLLTCGGFGTKADPAAAFQIQNQAADLGNSDAMFEIYVHYANGLGVPRDQQAAFAANKRAAEAGHSRAAYNLGAFFATGHLVPKDMTESVKWYERAADAGNAQAMANLALIYGTGDGVAKDLAYAEQLLDQADYLGLDVSPAREILAKNE